MPESMVQRDFCFSKNIVAATACRKLNKNAIENKRSFFLFSAVLNGQRVSTTLTAVGWMQFASSASCTRQKSCNRQILEDCCKKQRLLKCCFSQLFKSLVYAKVEILLLLQNTTLQICFFITAGEI